MNQPLDDSRLNPQELMVAVAERLDGVKEQFQDFRAETRGNFDAATKAVAELKNELKADGLAIREEMRAGFRDHEGRISNLEQNQAKAQGSVSFGKWFLGALGPLGSVIGFLAGKSQ